MIEFFQECFCTVNLPATGLLILVMLYWIFVIVGVVGIDAIDIDADFDVDADVDGNFDAGSGIFRGILDLFYVGEVPVVIVLSIFALCNWTTSMIVNHYLNPDFSLMTATMYGVPMLIVSLVATKFLTMPLAPIFRNYDDKNDTHNRYIGLIAKVTTSEVTDSFGQIEIKIDGPPLRINARTRPGERLGQGDAARIVQYNQSNDTFLVELTKWGKQ